MEGTGRRIYVRSGAVESLLSEPEVEIDLDSEPSYVIGNDGEVCCVSDEQTALAPREAAALAAIEAHPGITYRELAEILGVSKRTANDYVMKLGDLIRQERNESGVRFYLAPVRLYVAEEETYV